MPTGVARPWAWVSASRSRACAPPSMVTRRATGRRARPSSVKVDHDTVVAHGIARDVVSAATTASGARCPSRSSPRGRRRGGSTATMSAGCLSIIVSRSCADFIASSCSRTTCPLTTVQLFDPASQLPWRRGLEPVIDMFPSPFNRYRASSRTGVTRALHERRTGVLIERPAFLRGRRVADNGRHGRPFRRAARAAADRRRVPRRGIHRAVVRRVPRRQPRLTVFVRRTEHRVFSRAHRGALQGAAGGGRSDAGARGGRPAHAAARRHAPARQ